MWGEAVYHAQDAAPLFGLGNYHLGWVGSGAEDAAHFWDGFNGVQHIQRVEALSQKDNEAVPRSHCLGILLRQLDHLCIGAAGAHQAFPGRFAESHPKLDPRHAVDQRFVHILHSLDEVRLTQDEVEFERLFNGYRCQIHYRPPFYRT